jgi:hypothetical protein
MLGGPDPGPEEFLSDHGWRLEQLSDALRAEPESRSRSAELAEELRVHARIEERLCFPALVAANPLEARDVVAAARRAQAGLSQGIEQLSRAPVLESAELAASLADRVGSYGNFERARLLPMFSVLPAVTLREMGLEIQEILGRSPRARGA